MVCARCGRCCRNNGPIPPVVAGDSVPVWLHVLVGRMRRWGGIVGLGEPCVFLGGRDKNVCAIYGHRPATCREFDCHDKEGE